MKKFLFVLFLSISLVGYCQIPKAGKYDALVIGVDSVNNTITGYYENKTGENGMFSCTFMFSGKFKTLNDKTLEIKTYYPGEEDKIAGTLFCKNTVEFSLLLNDDHGGCWNVQTFKDEPVSFILIDQENWLAIKIIKSNKVYFYDDTNENKKGKAYVLKGDCVKVLSKSCNWLKVVYEGEKTIIGWIKTMDCY